MHVRSAAGSSKWAHALGACFLIVSAIGERYLSDLGWLGEISVYHGHSGVVMRRIGSSASDELFRSDK